MSTKYITLDNLDHFKDKIEEEINQKQDLLPQAINDRFLHTNASTGKLEWEEIVIPTPEYMKNIYWSSLKNLRDNNKLVPGMYYRIIDYNCTVQQNATNVSVAGHQFDIIVLALSTNTLAAEARAIQHEGDTYFANRRLDRWKLWYELDNNTWKYKWANNTYVGRGLIYRMIDEFNNEAPYDFKNILFKYNDEFVYTFNNVSNNENKDASLNGLRYCADNCIKYCLDSTDAYKQKLNFIILYSEFATGNFLNNYFDVGCESITIQHGALKNKFIGECRSVTMGRFCHQNYIKSSMSIGMGESSEHNKIYSGNMIYLATYCRNNEFKESCSTIYLGNYNTHLIFGPQCSNINIGTSSSNRIDYVDNIKFSKCAYLDIYCTDTSATYNNLLKNITIENIMGTPAVYNYGSGSTPEVRVSIEVPDRNLEYETTYKKDGSTEVLL